MAHPSGGSGSRFSTQHNFSEAYHFVGAGTTFNSTTGERIKVTSGVAGDGATPTLVFTGERNVHGRACEACWWFRRDCNGSWVGQCVEALDSLIG
jgi:hypothetical protein